MKYSSQVKLAKPDMMLRMIWGPGVLIVLLLAGCAADAPGETLEATLPDPNVEVVELPTQQSIDPVEPAPTTVPASTDPENQMAFGLESHDADFQDHDALIGEPGLTLMRHNGLLWSEVEAVEGTRDWSNQIGLEGILERSSASGLDMILILRGTPEWAQQVPGSFCGPIKPDKLQNYAAFVSEAVSRYSQPPYNVKYWELGNEPDVDPQLVRPNSVFGCWGNYLDAYYGGGYYADMLKVVYPAIKNADPEAVVLLGGLLLDCDPNFPPEGKDCSAGNFLEGVLLNGGGDYFDMVSFHGYTPYFGPETGFPYALSVDVNSPSWQHLGGVVLGKVNFIRQVLAKYGLEKPLIHTEGALMCAEYNPTDCEQPGELFFEAQADYAVRVYLRNWANGILGTIWYQFEGPGWRYGGLLDEEQNPKPVYTALQFMASRLSDASYIGEVSQFEGLQGYEFSAPDSRIWVLWSPEQLDTTILLPGDFSGIYDKYGSQINQEGSILIVNSPVYVEFQQ